MFDLTLDLALGNGSDDTSDRAPTDIAWAGSHSVAENSALGTVVGGALSATDPESEAVTFNLIDDAGGRFALGSNGTSIIVTGVLDYETATSHSITLRATDTHENTYDETFTITVTNVSETPPSNPLPDNGTTTVDDSTNFPVTPVATIVNQGVKLHGKKAANGNAGKFIYDAGDGIAANQTLVIEYTADWSLLSNTGKNAMVGFGFKTSNSFFLVGLRGDGATGVHKVRMNGASPHGWTQLSGFTTTDGGAAANGDQDGPNYLAITVRAGGTNFDFWSSSNGTSWSSELSNQAIASLSSFVGNDQEGIAAVFASNDTGPFSFNLLDYHFVSAPTITSSSGGSVAENATLSHSLTANQTVTWSIVGGADQTKFEISGTTLRWTGNGTKDFEAPDDADTNNTYIVTVRATNVFGQTTDQTITKTVTDVGGTPVTVYNHSITDADPGWSGFTIAQVIAAANLDNAAGSYVRLTINFTSLSAGAVVGAVYFGKKAVSGDAYDFAGDQVQITFNGGSNTITGDGSTLSFTSDWVALGAAYDESVAYTMAAQFNAGGTINVARALSATTGDATYYKAGADAATTNKSGYTFYFSNSAFLVSKVEIVTQPPA